MNDQGEEAPLPEKPKQVGPMSKRHSRIAKILSLLGGGAIWYLVYDSQELEQQRRLHSMQAKASDSGKPITHTSQETVSDKVKEVLTGDKKTPITTTINPTGQDPAFRVATSEAIITANEDGKIEKIQPTKDTNQPPLTPAEAQSTVDEALKDAAKKTLPKEEPTTSLPPKKD